MRAPYQIPKPSVRYGAVLQIANIAKIERICARMRETCGKAVSPSYLLDRLAMELDADAMFAKLAEEVRNGK